MLKGLLDRMFRRDAAPEPAREVLVLLNHNPGAPDEPGDVSIFGSVEAVSGDVFAVDVRSGEYLALDTAGRIVTMTPVSDEEDATIDCTVADEATHADLARRMLRHFLRYQVDEYGVDIAIDEINREQDIKRLIALVPLKSIYG